MTRFLPLLALLSILGGCANAPNCPSLPGGLGYCLQNSAETPAFSALQDVRLQRHEMDERLITQLEVDASGMRLVGLSPMGQRVLEARFDNQEASASSLAGDKLDARALLSMIQIATWPAVSVRAGLRWGWELEEDAHTRRVLREDETALVIERHGTPPHFYQLIIRLPHANMTLHVNDIERTTQ